jgi:hypothetical protein
MEMLFPTTAVSCLADDDVRGMVEQDPLADGGVRVDVPW